MTFEEWFSGNKYLLKPAGRHRQLFTMEDLEEAWNAAIMASIEQLSEGYWYWNVDKEDAVKQEQYTQGEYCMLPEDDIKKLLTS